MELRLYIRMLQRSWWLVILTALAALSAMLASLYVATPQYRATTRLLVVPNASLTESRDVVDSLDTLDRRSVVSTYAEVLQSERIYSELLTTLGVAPADLRDYARTAVVLPDASVLELVVTGPNPEVAALLANALARSGIEFAKALNSVFDMNVLDPATAPLEPYRPQPLQDASLALGLGLLAGSVLAIVREQLRIPLEALRRRFIFDTTSSAYTRRHFERRLEEAVGRARPGGLSLGLVRLEGLRDVIDTLPPLVLQRVLNHVTRTLGNELRGNDLVGRWDGITFSVLLPSTPSPAALRTLERIQRVLAEPVQLAEDRETLSLVPLVGVAAAEGGGSARHLIQQSEAALETARQQADIARQPSTSGAA